MIATLLVLFVVPSLLAIQTDLRGILRGRNPRPGREAETPAPV